MASLAERDYFTDHSTLIDPYAYFEAVRAAGPVSVLKDRDIVIVTGFKEAVDVLKNTEDFSSAIAPQGPAVPLPFTPEGEDITAQIEEHRLQYYGGQHLVAYDGQRHAQSRALLNRLFTPSRLKANEAFVESFAAELVADAVARGGCELIGEIATPFVTLVIADLLGVPAEDRQVFMDAIGAGPPPGSLDPEHLKLRGQSLVIMAKYFVDYVTKRRSDPRDDILSELANATFPDGSVPDAAEIVRLTTFLFGAGQDTSAKLLGNAIRTLADMPELQDRLRAEPALISDFIEEVLRLEGSSKITSRVARRRTRIGDLEIAPGTRVLVALAAANRDGERWPEPEELEIGRPRVREHLAFGRGAHVCAGAPLARVEVRIMLEQLLSQTLRIDLDETEHGHSGTRHLRYEPSFLIRGLATLKLKLTPK